MADGSHHEPNDGRVRVGAVPDPSAGGDLILPLLERLALDLVASKPTSETMLPAGFRAT